MEPNNNYTPYQNYNEQTPLNKTPNNYRIIILISGLLVFILSIVIIYFYAYGEGEAKKMDIKNTSYTNQNTTDQSTSSVEGGVSSNSLPSTSDQTISYNDLDKMQDSTTVYSKDKKMLSSATNTIVSNNQVSIIKNIIFDNETGGLTIRANNSYDISAPKISKIVYKSGSNTNSLDFLTERGIYPTYNISIYPPADKSTTTITLISASGGSNKILQAIANSDSVYIEFLDGTKSNAVAPKVDLAKIASVRSFSASQDGSQTFSLSYTGKRAMLSVKCNIYIDDGYEYSTTTATTPEERALLSKSICGYTPYYYNTNADSWNENSPLKTEDVVDQPLFLSTPNYMTGKMESGLHKITGEKSGYVMLVVTVCATNKFENYDPSCVSSTTPMYIKGSKN